MRQEAAIRERMEDRQTRKIEFDGFAIFSCPGVSIPRVDTYILYRAARAYEASAVWEPFAGSGAISIGLARRGARVWATDISGKAVACIRQNAHLNHCHDRIHSRRLDVAVAPKRKFDLIVANPPYTEHRVSCVEERMAWDPERKAIKAFMKVSRQSLHASGVILFSWPDYESFAMIESLMRKAGLEFAVQAELSEHDDAVRDYYLGSGINASRARSRKHHTRSVIYRIYQANL